MDLVCRWITGPDSGAVQRLTWHPDTGDRRLRVVIGRAGPFRCDDPALQPHHVLVEACAEPGSDGSAGCDLWVTQLTGTEPVRTSSDVTAARFALDTADRLVIGSSSCTLRVEDTPQPSAVPRRHSPAIVRTPRPVPSATDLARIVHLRRTLGDTPAGLCTTTAHDERDDRPPGRERPGGLVPMLIGLAGSAVVAVVTGHPMFLLFGAVGSLVAVSSWVAQWLAFRRRHQRQLDEHRRSRASRAARRAAACADDRALLERVTPTLGHALGAIGSRSPALWECRRADPDAFLVGLGIGDVRTADSTVTGSPVPASLGPGEHLAVSGPLAAAVTRSLVLQLVARCGPADLRLVIDADGWQWASGMPQVVGAPFTTGHDIGTYEELRLMLQQPASPHVVVVTDRIASLADPSSALRRTIDGSTAALIAICTHDPIPSCSTSALVTEHRPSRFSPDLRSTPEWLEVEVAGLGLRGAQRGASALHGLCDPEAKVDPSGHLPTDVDLDELEDGPVHPAAIAAGWATPQVALRTPLGIMQQPDGSAAPLHVDLVADGPHALIAGTTGAGKSELLRTLVIGLARRASPRHLAFVLVDYKGGAAFDAISALPHVAGVVTDLDDRLAERMLRSLHAEIRRREEYLRGAGAADLGEALRRRDADVPPRLVIVVDEFAALVAERPGFLHSLVGIAQRGRSLGLHLVLATQRPAGVVSDDIRANTALRISLRLHDRADALDVVGDDRPAAFPRRAPGRAVLRDGDRTVVVQTARCARLAVHVEALCIAAATAGVGGTRPPWLPPLPERLERIPDLPGGQTEDRVTTAGVAGVIDDPDRQRYLPLRVPAGPFAMVVAGTRGSGVSSTLAVIAHLTAHRSGTAIVLEAGTGAAIGDRPADPWRTLAERGVVVRLGADDDRLLQLCRHRVVDAANRDGRLLVVIDDLDALRRALSVPAHDHRPDRRHESRIDQLLDTLLQAHDAIDLAIGTSEPSTLPPALLARCETRWIHHLSDSSSAAALGVPARLVPPPVPGRLVVDGLDAQVLAPQSIDGAARPAPAASTGRAAWPIVIPALIEHSSLPPVAVDRHRVELAVGIDLETGRPARLAVDHGEHVLVIGPRRSGRTSAVGLLADLLRAAGSSVLAVDDVERHDDLVAPGVDAAIGAGSPDHAPTCVLSASGDALRVRHGWWTAVVRRIRCGVVLAGPDAPSDGELLGVSLPRGFPVAVRAGRGWLVDHGVVTPVQLAVGPHLPASGSGSDSGLSASTR